MGIILAFLVLGTLPVFIGWLGQNPHRRPWAFTAIGLAIFFGDSIRISGSLIAWPVWSGVARGLEVSAIDTLAIALIMTRRAMPGRLPFWGLISLYAVMLGSSVLISAVPMASSFSCWQFGRVLLVFAAIGGECHRDDARKGLLAGLAMGLLLQAGYVIEQKASGVVQATGTMVHQNALGMMTELALIPLLAAMLGGDRRKLILAGVAGGMIVITGGGSRGTMSFALGGAGLLVLLSLIRGVTPAKTRVAGLAVLAVALATPIAVVTLKDRFGDGAVTTLDDQRPKFEQAARFMAEDHPFGVGANMYVTTANSKGYADRAGVAWNFSNRSASVHNAYLLARAETGWLGEGALILLLTLPLLRGLQLAFARRQGMPGEVALGSAVAMGVNIVHNNYEYALYIYAVLTLVFINMGLIASQIRLLRQRPKPGQGQAPRRVPPSRVAPGLAVAGRQPR